MSSEYRVNIQQDDSTPTDSSVAVENMTVRLSLVTLTPFVVPPTTRTSTQRNNWRGARGHPGYTRGVESDSHHVRL